MAEKKVKENEVLEEYFTSLEENEKNSASNQIFSGEEDVDLKTELDMKEIARVNAMIVNDNFLNSRGIPSVFDMYYNPYFRLKISLNRKSRGEFVSINKASSPEDMERGLTLGMNMGNSQK